MAIGRLKLHTFKNVDRVSQMCLSKPRDYKTGFCFNLFANVILLTPREITKFPAVTYYLFQPKNNNSPRFFIKGKNALVRMKGADRLTASVSCQTFVVKSSTRPLPRTPTTIKWSINCYTIFMNT